MPDPIGPTHNEVVTVDGTPVVVHGNQPLGDEGRAAIAEVIRAAAKRFTSTRPTDADLQRWRDTIESLPMSAARFWAYRLLGELRAERQRATTSAEVPHA